MRLVALVESPEHVCCRYRINAFRPWLERSGHELELQPWPKRWWSRLQMSEVLGDADVVILQRKLLPLWDLYLLRCAAHRLVFDFDDAVFLRDSFSPRGLHSARRLHRFMATLETMDAVVAGNRFLASEASRWIPPGRLMVVPTCVDAESYPRAAHQAAGPAARLVWVGSSSTLQGLEAARDILDHVGQGLPGLRLNLVCDRPLTLGHLAVDFRPWAEATEAADIAAADIGVAWVPDDLWSRGKCGLKVLQYMAAGLPVVANPVGVHTEMVRHGVTGFLARTPGEWLDCVGELARNPGLRKRMGTAARNLAEKEYGTGLGAHRWLALLNRFRKAARQVA